MSFALLHFYHCWVGDAAIALKQNLQKCPFKVVGLVVPGVDRALVSHIEHIVELKLIVRANPDEHWLSRDTQCYLRLIWVS